MTENFQEKQRRARERTRELHEQRPEQEPGDTQPAGWYRNTGAAEVVPGYQLANALRAWVHLHELEYPEPTDYGFTGPVQLIAEHSGMSERRIYDLVNCKQPTVSLEVAEKVLMAIGREHLLVTEVQVLPSPYWSLEKWVAYMHERGCCDYEF